jgi:DeoR/GlpR family transcriptional regulator of sugar metabolism
MLVAERHREILNIVERDRSVRVGSLARLFQVTEETIRRDLEKLDADGKLIRSHGGAVSSHAGGREAPYSEREVRATAEKNAIAREAVKLVCEGDTILMDASTTVLQMARMLPDLPVTVVTNAALVAIELSSRARVRVVCTGGTLSPASQSFVGPHAERTLSDYHVDRLFFSCTAVDVEYGLSDTNEAQAAIRQKMMEVAQQRCLLVDAGKFGLKALKRFGHLADVDTLITNEGVDGDLVERIDAAGPSMIVARVL